MDFQKAFVFLFLGVLGLAASAADECTKALEGSSYTIALNSPKQEGDVLAWKHNDKNVVYLRRRGKTTGEGRVDDNGSLLLKNLTSAMSGSYRAEHHDRQGTLVKTITEKLCVIPKAPVPTLVVTCSSSGVGSLYCASGSSKGFTLLWFHNNVDLKERVNPFTPTQPGEKDQYKCRLSNDLYLGDTQDSNDVIISCPRPVPVLSRVVRLVLAGGVLLIVILTLALVIGSCKYCPQRNRKRVHEHVRLSSLRDTRSDPPQWKPSPPGDQGYSHTPQEDPSPAASQPGDQGYSHTPQGYSHTPQEDPSPAASQPGDQGYSHTPQEDPSPAASQPGAQPSPQPLAAAAAAEKLPHTPVPQPRKKLNLIPKANDSDTSANGQDCV